MTLKFYWYPNCGSCKKAKNWFDANEVSYEAIHIVEETPTKEELLKWMQMSDLSAKKFFNTSGKVYRELNMKDKLKEASLAEMAAFLASDGMLIKRPIVTNGEKVTVGFKEEEFEALWLAT